MLSDAIKQRIAELSRSGMSLRAIMREVGCSWDGVKRWAVRPESQKTRVNPDPLEAERERLAKLRDYRQERELIQAIAGERSFRSHLESLLRDVAPRLDAPPPYRPPRVPDGASVETMLFLWSDWHAYEVVRRERTLGLNEYDGPVFGRRVHRVVDAGLSIKARMERGGGWHFPRAVVACNGDFVSGTIHEVERHSDARNVVDAVFRTGMVLASALRDMAAEFESIDVFCTSGNHGRLPDARKMQQKDPTRSWDTAIYLYAMTALSHIPSVRFHIPDSYSVMYEVEGWRFLQYHGHDIKSWNSIPFYGISRYTRNVNALPIAPGPPHFYLISHFHSSASLPAPGGRALVNGSLIGGTEYSLNTLGAVDRPMQLMATVHPEHRIASTWELHADGDGPGYDVASWG